MRNLWMIISGLAVVVGIGGSVYYFFPKQSDTSNASLLSSTDSHVFVVPSENPLLTADEAQFDRWIPFYPIRCGEIVFDNVDPKHNFSFCIDEIKRRVARGTRYQLSNDEVLDSRVKARWHQVAGSK